MGNEELKASIIVLTYKNFSNIVANITSILKQTYKNYEVIISDDGSPNYDKTYIESIFKEDENAHKFTVVTREKNVGTVKNYNAAIKEATGDIIVPLSQDDVFIDEQGLSRIMEMFLDTKVNVCLGARKNVVTNSIIPNNAQATFMKNAENKKLWLRNACGNLYWGAVLYYRRDYLLKIGLFDESYVLIEDYSTVMRIIEKGEKIYIMDLPTIFYGMDGITKSSNKKNNYNPNYVRDGIHICEDNYRKSKKILNSIVCRQYLKYNLKWWKRNAPEFRVNMYSNIIIDIIIIVSEIISVLTGENVNDCRFNILWKFEKLATKIRPLAKQV